MSPKTLNFTDELYAYYQNMFLREPDALKKLREDTAKIPGAEMQIAPEQGQFMAFLLKLMGAKRVLEIGTFTGYSATVMAMALPEDGHLYTIDLPTEPIDMARAVWAQTGVADIITFNLNGGDSALDDLLSQSANHASYDFAFIDANKDGYRAYYEKCLQLVRPGGIIALDNIFMDGRVTDNAIDKESVAAMRAFNKILKNDDRVDLSVIPIADGLALARKL